MCACGLCVCICVCACVYMRVCMCGVVCTCGVLWWNHIGISLPRKKRFKKAACKNGSRVLNAAGVSNKTNMCAAWTTKKVPTRKAQSNKQVSVKDNRWHEAQGQDTHRAQGKAWGASLTHTHTYTHTRTHTYTYTHTCSDACKHAHTHARRNTHTNTYTHTRKYARSDRKSVHEKYSHF